MRNLKRALSLTLASVMLLGMMVVGSSAAAGYSDVDENDNVEAIEVLQEIEVMVGDDRGFGPDRPVTRNEMAVVMGKLLNLNYNYYASACPFTDVADWARGWVGACAANGIVSGRGEGIYDGEATVTAVEAASMMMRALGYFKYTEDYADGFQLVTVRQGSEIGIFNGIGTDATTPMTRNQVAQMALNALRSNMVNFTGTPGIEVNGVKVGYKAEYTPRTGTEAKYDAITGLTTTILTDNGQYFIQLGEQLYDGKLRLEDTTDDFGRPARYWEYDGSGIGTYVKEELVRKEYVGKVTSADLYSLLGASALKNNELVVYIDGVADATVNTDVFDVSDLSRTNTKAVGGTGTGVLTQVFVDSAEKLITVSVINTYLAEATANYSEKKASLALKAYNVTVDTKNSVSKDNKDGVKDATATVTAYSEDYALVESAEKGDFFLVTLACGKVQSIVTAPTVDDVTLNSFKRGNSVTGGSTTYDYASTAQYDDDVLDQYDQSNMKNTTYKLYLDQYDNLIGIEIVDEELNYVFIAGFEDFSKVLSKADAEAFGVFPDGTSATITVKDAGEVLTAGGTKWSDLNKAGTNLVNQWYTYTTDKNGDYTLGRIPYALGTGRVAQGYKDANVTINKSHVSLVGDSGLGERAYGNDETIYMLAKQSANSSGQPVVSGVDFMVTGVNNADIEVYDTAKGVAGGFHGYSYLYNSKGYIIAVVAEGEDKGTAKDYAFILDSEPRQEDYSNDADEWTWYRKAIVNGEEVELREKGSTLTYLGEKSGNGDMDQYEWFRVSYDKDGYVVGTSAKANTATTWNSKTPVNFTTDDNKENIYLLGSNTFTTNSNIVENDVALIAQAMYTSDAKLGLTLDNYTLYAYDDRDTADTGIHLKRDANAVLVETDVDGERVIRYFDDGDGHDNVDAALNAMKKDADGKNKFNGTVYYVMKDGEATTIIIVDNDSQTSEGIQGPNNKKVATLAYAPNAKKVVAEDKSGAKVEGAVITLEMLRDTGYVKVGEFITGADGATGALPVVSGNTYRAVCGTVELVFTAK